MTTVHVENTVPDFDVWKANFDKYERFRAEQGVRSYRISRGVTQPAKVLIDLQFDDDASAAAFLPRLARIMATPQAQSGVTEHRPPEIYTVVTEREPALD
jgi:hypothetical protein